LSRSHGGELHELTTPLRQTFAATRPVVKFAVRIDDCSSPPRCSRKKSRRDTSALASGHVDRGNIPR
jgi:hypothetical protein